jgi:hypothetical protein
MYSHFHFEKVENYSLALRFPAYLSMIAVKFGSIRAEEACRLSLERLQRNEVCSPFIDSTEH